VTGKIYTLVSGGQAHTIQIVRAHTRDFTMAAAGQAFGLGPVCDRLKLNYLRDKMLQEHKLIWYVAIIWTFIYVNYHKT